MVRLIALLLMLSITGCASTSAQSQFWDWFQAHATELKVVKQSDAPVMDVLHERLRAVHEGLTYEMSMHDGAIREIIISGDGVAEMIPVVRRLIAAAPRMQGWEVIGFRPRMQNYAGFSLSKSGHVYDSTSLWFHAIIEDGHFDLILYHPQYREEERSRFVNALYIQLDTALGEFDVMTGIRWIDFQRLPEDPAAQGLMPFARLREVFDSFNQSRPR